MERAEEQDVDMAFAADINGDEAAAPVYFSLSCLIFDFGSCFFSWPRFSRNPNLRCENDAGCGGYEEEIEGDGG